ncbi:hypothetical protein GGE18_005072 [Rhizobium esperanzae]|nr:hypothetical protein [Rhizobium esperanzae]
MASRQRANLTRRQSTDLSRAQFGDLCRRQRANLFVLHGRNLRSLQTSKLIVGQSSNSRGRKTGDRLGADRADLFR